MIKIATAECFTQGKIGRELHALAQSYEGIFGLEYIENIEEYGDFDYNDLSVTCSLFIPTIEAMEKVLNVENPPKPDKLIKGIKVYDEAGDKAVSKIMAKAVKELSGCDIAIGTTAGIGHGGISIITDNYEITTTTDIYADLCEKDSEKLFQRSENGIEKTLEILLLLLNNKFNQIKSFKNVEIKKLEKFNI
ncbi:FeGP cofactor biosynthesis protein HcgF family protein [uncultured Methanobrevibacter sp.]|uniref:FeGP cofactor biosynthesis protein HcgF family protein n=1 Tax=uncultured Methanobrevibacter sp. TaxID=253161 RepID=UPI0025E57BCC|nr:FeGP cofactor biosynthesis protein HcgF family protein [uncultured Methanobrevibacter sp.]